jgi:hypothetical protein
MDSPAATPSPPAHGRSAAATAAVLSALLGGAVLEWPMNAGMAQGAPAEVVTAASASRLGLSESVCGLSRPSAVRAEWGEAASAPLEGRVGFAIQPGPGYGAIVGGGGEVGLDRR